MFMFNIKNAFKSKDIVYVLVLTLFFFMMMIENVLERQNGVLLFSFLINFFGFKNAKTFGE